MTNPTDNPVLDHSVSLSSQEWFPLASNQREIWFHQALEPQSPTYNVGGYLDCPVPPDRDRIQKAWSALVAQHDALRLQVRDHPGGSPEQRVLDQVPAQVEVLDFQQHDDPESAAVRWMEDAMDRALDLKQVPLFEMVALLVSPNRFFFFLKCHHVIIDGWAFSLLARALVSAYSQLGEGGLVEQDVPSYRPFVQSQLDYLDSGGHQRDLDFWQKVYPVAPATLMPHDLRQSSDPTCCGKSVLRLERAFYDRLETLTSDPSVTAFHAILAALHGAFAGFRSEAGMAIGLPILNRVGAVQRRTAGMFVHAIPFWVEPPPDATHVEMLHKVAADLRSAYRHRRCPLGEINRAAELVGSGQTQMFDMTLSFERHDYEGLIDGVAIKAVPLTNSVTPLPLSMFVREFQKQADVEVEFTFREDCLSSETVGWLMQRFRSHLEAFVENPAGRVRELPMLSEDEQQCLRKWNQTDADLVMGRTVVGLFEAIAEQEGDRVAAVEVEEALDYRTLNSRANQLACFLKAEGYSPGSVVGVRMERGLGLVTALLGILKAGLVYLPLGVESVQDRLVGIVRDARVSVVLASVESDALAESDAVRVIGFEEAEAAAAGFSGDTPPIAATLDDPAYCIFTSGSTGQPKGTVLKHDGLANVVLDLIRIHRLTRETRTLQFAATTFDASIIELLGTLCAGGSLQIPPADQPMVPDSSMIRFMESRRITHAILPPAVLSILPQAALSDLSVLISAGDACPREVVERWAPGRLLINGYGPTECTVCATTARCLPGEPRPVIGSPIANTRIHIVDREGREVPIGVAGEIAIAGKGVAAGYLSDAGTDREVFAELSGLGRVYLTGDVGRWRVDGQVEHLGRIDRQAKIRGHRVDPGEVEAAIRSHPEVSDTVVVACGEAPMQWLAAYVAPQTSVDELRHHLSGRLPHYMMPVRVVCLSELPRTAHGKVDLAALPAPGYSAADAKQTPPRDSLDQRLQSLWAKALGIEKPGIDEDFFLLGGDSLKAAFLGNEIERELDVTIPMAILLDQPTIRNVADRLRALAKGEVIEWPVILPLRPQGTQTPFFCFPGANASGFYLQALAGELSADIPFYAFQWQGMEPGTQPLETVAELASLYVAEIRRARSHGPYRVGGHSIGGVIAFEVARRLEAAGEQVEDVIIFDTTLAEPGDREPGEDLREASFLSDMLKVCGWDPKRADVFPVTDQGKLVDGPEVFSFVRRFLVAQSLLPYNCSEEQLKRVVSIWRAVAAAHDNYRPDGPINAPITLFMAREIPIDVPRKEQRAEGWGWPQWTRSAMNLEWVDGNHVQILSPPYVTQVAERLNQIIGGQATR